MNTKSIDVNSLIQQKLAKYPEGSLSAREVLTTIPHGTEEMAQRLDTAITKAIYQKAAEFAAQHASVTKPRGMGFKPVAAMDFSVNPAEKHKEEMTKLSAEVMSAVQQAVKGD